MNVLTEKFIKEKFFKNSFKLYHSADDREYWESLEVKDELYEVAEKYKDYTPKVLLATAYLRFVRDGNRTEYEGEYFKRRNALRLYTILEAIENKGEYVDRIIDLVWLILEETTWVLPAHTNNMNNVDGLPDGMNDGIDLFAAETASTLAFVYEVVGKKLDEVSKNITSRMLYELNKRIIDNYLDKDVPKWWFCWNSNWNVWIHSNLLAVAPIVCNDEEKLTRLILNAEESINAFKEAQPEDGAYEEGPSYWGLAGAALIDCEWLLYNYSDGAYDCLFESKMKEIARYFMKLYICKGRVANYCDAPGKLNADYGLQYTFGKIYNDDELIAFAKQVFDIDNIAWCDDTKPYRLLSKMEAKSKLKNMEKIDLKAKSYYFESLQVVSQHMNSGMYFSAIAGNNGVGHNHNDVGSFIVFKNNVPFIIDAGAITYERDTFSDKRYTIWNNMSEYHSVPKIGGVNQHCGAEYCATDVVYTESDFSFDMANAYENRDEIVKWKRSFDYSGAKVVLDDDFDLKEEKEVIFHLMLAAKPEINDGEIVVKRDGETLTIELDTTPFEFEIEEIDHPDMLKYWDSSIYRLKAKTKAKAMQTRLVIG